MKVKLQYDPLRQHDGGVLWLTFEDFMREFATLFVCRCGRSHCVCRSYGAVLAHKLGSGME